MLRCKFRFKCTSKSVVGIMIKPETSRTKCGYLMVFQVGEHVRLDVTHKDVSHAECIAARLTQANAPSRCRVLASAGM